METLHFQNRSKKVVTSLLETTKFVSIFRLNKRVAKWRCREKGRDSFTFNSNDSEQSETLASRQTKGAMTDQSSWHGTLPDEQRDHTMTRGRVLSRVSQTSNTTPTRRADTC